MRFVPTKGTSDKIAAGLDMIITLVVEQIGYTYHLPAYHPAILTIVAAMTYFLFKWKREISIFVLNSLGPIQNKNSYTRRRIL